jgi:hypothetical protein
MFAHVNFPVPLYFFFRSAELRGDQIGLFKLVTLNYILNRITGVTFDC